MVWFYPFVYLIFYHSRPARHYYKRNCWLECLTLARGTISARGFEKPFSVSVNRPHYSAQGQRVSARGRSAPVPRQPALAERANKPRWRHLSSNCWDPTLRRVPTPQDSVVFELWHHTCSVLSRGVEEGKLGRAFCPAWLGCSEGGSPGLHCWARFATLLRATASAVG